MCLIDKISAQSMFYSQFLALDINIMLPKMRFGSSDIGTRTRSLSLKKEAVIATSDLPSQLSKCNQELSYFKIGQQQNLDSEDKKHLKRTKQSTETNNTRNSFQMEKQSLQKIEKGHSLAKLTSIQRYRSLLPDFLNAKFPSEISILHSITQKIDNYLYCQGKTKTGLKNNFKNVQNYLKMKENTQVEQIHLTQINYVFTGFYVYYQDPLKNLVIEVPRVNGKKSQTQGVRAHSFRKKLYEIYQKMILERRQLESIGTIKLHVKRTSQFFPVTQLKQRVNKQKNYKNIQLKQKFVQQILSHVHKKQQEIQQICNKKRNLDKQKDQKPTINELKQLKAALICLYEERKVRNMFKCTAINLLQQKTAIKTDSILEGLQILVNKNEQVSEFKIGNNLVLGLYLEQAIDIKCRQESLDSQIN